MANITGTEGADTLRGTNIKIDPVTPGNSLGSGDDTITALGGNDIIIGSNGIDKIDGGAGNDTLDYSKIGKGLFLEPSGSFIDTVGFRRRSSPDPTELAATSSIANVETIIGDPTQSNTINDFTGFAFDRSEFDINLSTGRVLTLFNNITYTVKNFDNITLPGGTGRFVGNDRDNQINVGDTAVITASKGNDTLRGGTLDYSNLGQAIKFSPTLLEVFSTAGIYGNINKGNVGVDRINTDKLSGLQKIIGTTNKVNTLDLSTINQVSIVDLNLSTNSLNVKNPYYDPNNPFSTPNLSTQVINFVDAFGSKGNDKIVGGNKNSKLTGGGGNDTITGGSKNDIITGSDRTARGVGEVDILTGGGGRDKFILGDKNGAYYVGKGNDDYATITDFNLFQDSISIGSLKNYSFAADGNNTIELYSGKDVKTRDLIAKIQLAGEISNASSNSRSIAGSSPNVDAIISKIDIISETNLTG